MINIQKINDNECLKWCIVRYLHPADHHAVRIRKIDEILTDELYFEDIKSPVKIKNIRKIKKRTLSALVFLVIKTRKNIQSIYQKSVIKRNMLIYY